MLRRVCYLFPVSVEYSLLSFDLQNRTDKSILVVKQIQPCRQSIELNGTRPNLQRRIISFLTQILIKCDLTCFILWKFNDLIFVYEQSIGSVVVM